MKFDVYLEDKKYKSTVVYKGIEAVNPTIAKVKTCSMADQELGKCAYKIKKVVPVAETTTDVINKLFQDHFTTNKGGVANA